MESKTRGFKVFLFILVCAGKLNAEDVPEKLTNSVPPAIPSADDVDGRSTLLQQVKENEKLVLELHGQFRIQQNQIQVLEARDQERQQQIQILEARDKEHQQKIQVLEARDKERQQQIQVLEARDKERQQQLQIFETRFNDKQRQFHLVNHLEENVAGTKQRIRRAENEAPVAFLATISDHTIPHAGDHQVIVFDNTITNVGNAYNEHLGSFIAPVSGIYVFSTTLFSPSSVSFHADLVRNGQTITKMYLSGAEVGGYDTASQTVVLVLQKGDDVCIQHRDTDRTVNGYHYSLFSGFLLQQNYTASVIVG